MLPHTTVVAEAATFEQSIWPWEDEYAPITWRPSLFYEATDGAADVAAALGGGGGKGRPEPTSSTFGRIDAGTGAVGVGAGSGARTGASGGGGAALHGGLGGLHAGADERERPSADELADMAVRVIYQDNDLLVLDKPSGLLSVPGINSRFSLAGAVAHKYGHDRIDRMITHRLDEATSGVLVFARTPEAQKSMYDQFRSRTVKVS